MNLVALPTTSPRLYDQYDVKSYKRTILHVHDNSVTSRSRTEAITENKTRVRARYAAIGEIFREI